LVDITETIDKDFRLCSVVNELRYCWVVLELFIDDEDTWVILRQKSVADVSEVVFDQLDSFGRTDYDFVVVACLDSLLQLRCTISQSAQLLNDVLKGCDIFFQRLLRLIDLLMEFLL